MALRPSDSSARLEQVQEQAEKRPSATRTSKKITRRTFIKRCIGAALAAPLLTGAYARWGEPRQLWRRTLTVSSARIPASFHGVTIAHLSDLHYAEYVTKEHIAKIVDDVMKCKPDMICFTGDLVDDGRVHAGTIRDVLMKLQAPLGKYAVLGNHDYVRRKDLVTEPLRASGFQVLTNKNYRIYHRNEAIVVAGIDDALEGYPDMEAALRGSSEDTWCLLLAHEPDWADEASRYAVDLQLSGHSHGGQVRIPFAGPLFLPLMAKKYPDGTYEIKRGQGAFAGRGDLIVHTSRGLGMSMLPIRFYCPPEWTLITLQSTSN